MAVRMKLSKTSQPLAVLITAAYVKDVMKTEIEWGSATAIELSTTFSLTGALSIVRFLARSASGALYGSSPLESTEIDSWLDLALSLQSGQCNSLDVEKIETGLRDDGFLVGNAVTLADIAVWSAIEGNGTLLEKTRDESKLSRWFSRCNDVEQFKEGKNMLPKNLEKQKDEGKFVELPGAEKGKVVGLFPPEASGYLHIGHAKAALLNQYYQQTFSGKLIMRFDDTNPIKEKADFEDVILGDLKLLQVNYDHFSRTSDHFDLIISYAEKLIREGKAYVDDTPKEEMQKEREQRSPSKNRENDVETNLKLWKEMIAGSDWGLECCVRAKIDYTSDNGCLRDPTIYRCRLEPHVCTGTKYKVYPTYDFACPIVDSVEGVTHALRTMEYHDRDDQYYWFIEQLGLRKPYIWEYSRLNLQHTVLSKRKLTWFVEQGLVDGWDDPRFPTVRGVLRRGMTVEGLRQFIIAQGSSKATVTMEWDKIWAFNRKVIDPVAPRYTAIEKTGAVLITLSGAPKEASCKEVAKHPKNPEVGTKSTWCSPNVWIEKVDADLLKKGDIATLINWGNVVIEKIVKRGSREIDQRKARLGKQDSVKLTWLAEAEEAPFVPCVCSYYENIITKPIVTKEDDFKLYVNHNSKREVEAFGDPCLADLKKGDIIQLQRKGFFICDQPYEPVSIHTSVTAPCCLIAIPDSKAMTSSASGVTSSEKGKGKGKKGESSKTAEKKVEVKVAESAMKECGADVNATDAEGNCPLSIAVTNRNWSLAKLLISFGCKLNEKWGTHKQTILHLVAMQWHDDESLLFVQEIMPRVHALADCRDLNEKVPFELARGEMRRHLFEAWRGCRYSKLYEKGRTKPSRVKVCLMGNSCAGKTTLMNSLRRERVKMSFHSRTAGVDIVTAAIDSAGELVFCDFVGQPTFHKMHGLFFSEATTIFILVVDLTMSEEELATCAFYWLSFVKYSIRMKGKAMLVLVGSRGDQDSGEKLREISNHLRRSFTMGENFVLDCREQESAGLQKLRECLGSLKQKCIEYADEVPTIVETVQLSLLPQVRDLLQKSEGDALKEMAEKNMLPQALFKLINCSDGDPIKMLEALKGSLYEDIYSEINSTLQNFGLTTLQLTKIERQYIHVGLLKALIEKNVYPGLKNEELDPLVAFLHGIGEILVVENQVVLDPPWLCQSIIGPLMSPDYFPVHLEGIVDGIVSKDQVKAALEVFSEANQTSSIAVDEAIEILCHLEICYPVKELPDAPVQYQFPALIQTLDRKRLWRRKEDIVLYVGRRLQCKEKTDIITPGTMPFIQSRAAIKLHPTPSLVWKGGLMMQRTINGCRIEGLIELQEYEKSIDFVVRGPHDSEGECMTLLNEMLKLGQAVLEEKSAGTDISLLYISRTDLQKLSAQPLAYASEVVEHAKQLGSTTATVSCAVRGKGLAIESLGDLLVVPEDHYLLLSAQSRRTIADCLNKDTADRRTTFATELHKLTVSTYAQCRFAEEILARWSESFYSTRLRLAEAAKKADVLYVLAILEDEGVIELSDDERTRAKDALFSLGDAQT